MAEGKNIDVKFRTTADTKGAEKMASGLKATAESADDAGKNLAEIEKRGQAAYAALDELNRALGSGDLKQAGKALDDAAEAISEFGKVAGVSSEETARMRDEMRGLIKEGDDIARHQDAQNMRMRILAGTLSHGIGKLSDWGKELQETGKTLEATDADMGRSMQVIGAWTDKIGSAASSLATGFAAGGPLGAAVAGLGWLVGQVFQSMAANAEAAAARQMVMKEATREVTKAMQEMSKADAALQLTKDIATAAEGAAGALDRETAAWERKNAAIERTIKTLERERRQAQAEGDAKTEFQLAQLDAGEGEFAGLSDSEKAKERGRIMQEKRRRDFENDERLANATVETKTQDLNQTGKRERDIEAKKGEAENLARNLLSRDKRKKAEGDIAAIGGEDGVIENLTKKLEAVEAAINVVEGTSMFGALTGSERGDQGALSKFLNRNEIKDYEANKKKREGLLKQRQLENARLTGLKTTVKADDEAKVKASEATGAKVNSADDLQALADQYESELEKMRGDKEKLQEEIDGIVDERESARNVAKTREATEDIRTRQSVGQAETKETAAESREQDERDRERERASRDGTRVAGEVSSTVRGDLTAKAQKALDLAVNATKDGTTSGEGDRVISIIEQLLAALENQNKTPANDPKAQRLAQLEADMRGVISRLNKGDK